MEDHSNKVCSRYIYVCISILLFIGSSGDVFPNLSVGSHTINVRFTPDGHCEPIMDQLSLDFNISMPSTTSPRKSNSVCTFTQCM